MGGRLFDIWEAAGGSQVDISRLPSFGRIKRNDVLVFNFLIRLDGTVWD